MRALRILLISIILAYTGSVNAQTFTEDPITAWCYNLPLNQLNEKYKTYAIEWTLPPVDEDLSKALQNDSFGSLKEVTSDQNPDITMMVKVTDLKFGTMESWLIYPEKGVYGVKIPFSYHINIVMKDNLDNKILLNIEKNEASEYKSFKNTYTEVNFFTKNPSQIYNKLCSTIACFISKTYWSHMREDFIKYPTTYTENVFVMNYNYYYQYCFYRYYIAPLFVFFAEKTAISKRLDKYRELYNNFEKYNNELLEFYASINSKNTEVIVSKGYYNLAVFSLLVDDFDEMEAQLNKITDPQLAPQIAHLRSRSADIKKRLAIYSKVNRYLD